MVPWHFLPYRLVQLMANLCSHHCSPYAPSGRRSRHRAPDTILLPQMQCLISRTRRERREDLCHRAAAQLITRAAVRVHPRHCTLSNWLAEKRPRQTLIGIEWDCSVRRRPDFANVSARIWQDRWSERDFGFSLLFCYPVHVGNR